MNNKPDYTALQVGDTVRFVCHKQDDEGRQTDRIMKFTGKLIEIEDNRINSPDFPTYHVRRNGKNYWYFGDGIILIKKGKKNGTEQRI